jgi:DNA polymerase-1
LKGIYFDILIAAYLLNPGERRYQLENLVFSELGIDSFSQASPKGNGQATQLTLALEVDLKELSQKACESVTYFFPLKVILENKLRKEDLFDIFENLEMPLITVLSSMENNGIKINEKFLNSLEVEVSKKIKVLEDKIYKEAGKEFNINSTKQLREILFTDLELPTKGIKKTKTGFSTAEDELNKLKELHPIISLMLDYRELSKLETTYLKALPRMINPKTKRIHTHFSQVVAATGRLSSHDPNLQNIPTKTTEGRRIRQAFVAEAGSILVGFDYSQIELRLAAHFSKDEKMIKAFKTQADIHTETAAQINGILSKDVSHKMRQEAKAINFGILYGQGPHGLSQSAGIPYSQAQEFIKKYFITYPNIKIMVDNFIEEAEKKGYASTLIGRKRPLPDINSTMPLAKKSAQRMAINTPIQGAAADLIKKAMIKVMALIVGKEDEIKLLLQVHDELIFEIKENRVEKYSLEIEKIMQENSQLTVPLIVERSSGKTWENLK